MMMKAQIAFEHASQLRHIVIHKASTRSKDNLPVTLRRLGDGVKFSRHLADFASAGMRGQARLSPMAPSRLHEGAAWESPNALSPTDFQGLLVCVSSSFLYCRYPCSALHNLDLFLNLLPIHSLCRCSCLSR